MKLSKFIITASLFTAVAAQAADYGYVCHQRTDRSPVDPKIGKIAVTVKHLQTIATATDYRGEYVDSVDKVKVEITSTKKNKTTKLKSVNAIATSEDVQFNINDNGVSFYLYMDELEEAGLTLKINGKKTEISLTCDFAPTSALNIKENGKLISVADLINDDIDVQSNYDLENFCYTGDIYQVTNQIKTWNLQGLFFSGGGGGFELKKIEVIRGIVSYNIRLKLEDEVVPGEFKTVSIKPCRI